MRKLIHVISRIHSNEEGHAQVSAGFLVSAAGMVALGIGAANDTGWLAVTGGIVAGVGLLAGHLLDHRAVDADQYARIERLEKK